MRKIKVVSVEFCTEKSVGSYVYLLAEWCKGAPKITIFWNIVILKNEEVDSLLGWMLPKIRIISKNASNEESHTRRVF